MYKDMNGFWPSDRERGGEFCAFQLDFNLD